MVVAGFVGPLVCKDLTDVAEVLPDQLLLDGLLLRGQKSGTDTLGGNLDERNGVFHDFEVGGDLQPSAEALPLAPGGGVFIENSGI